MFNNFFFNRAVYETMWINMLKRGSPQMAIWRMRIECWIPKATNTHSEYVTRIAFYCNNGCTNAPERYVIRTLPVLLNIIISLSA
jgi:hypothetical protein